MADCIRSSPCHFSQDFLGSGGGFANHTQDSMSRYGYNTQQPSTQPSTQHATQSSTQPSTQPATQPQTTQSGQLYQR